MGVQGERQTWTSQGGGVRPLPSLRLNGGGRDVRAKRKPEEDFENDEKVRSQRVRVQGVLHTADFGRVKGVGPVQEECRSAVENLLCGGGTEEEGARRGQGGKTKDNLGKELLEVPRQRDKD